MHSRTRRCKTFIVLIHVIFPTMSHLGLAYPFSPSFISTHCIRHMNLGLREPTLQLIPSLPSLLLYLPHFHSSFRSQEYIHKSATFLSRPSQVAILITIKSRFTKNEMCLLRTLIEEPDNFIEASVPFKVLLQASLMFFVAAASSS